MDEIPHGLVGENLDELMILVVVNQILIVQLMEYVDDRIIHVLLVLLLDSLPVLVMDLHLGLVVESMDESMFHVELAILIVLIDLVILHLMLQLPQLLPVPQVYQLLLIDLDHGHGDVIVLMDERILHLMLVALL